MSRKKKSAKPAQSPPVETVQTRPAQPAHVENPPVPDVSQPVTVSDDLSASVASSLANAPLPNESAIDAHAQRQAAEAGRAAEEGDKPKRRYKPRTTSTGGPAPFVAPGNTPDAKKLAYRQAGRAMADTLILVGQTMGGEDWKPVLQLAPDKTVLYDERSTLREAWADMAEEYEISKMPAWAACAIATAAYVGPRLNAPSTISRWEKVQLWWKSRKMEKAEKEKQKREAKEAANAA